MNNSTQQEGRLRSKEEVLRHLIDSNNWGYYYDNIDSTHGTMNTFLYIALKAMEEYHQQFSSPPTVSELKSKFAEHLGEKELNTTDADAIEWAAKNIS